MQNGATKPLWIKITSILAIVFGIMTVLEGGKALFTSAGLAQAGNVVPFVLWFNFFAGLLYIIAGVALFKENSCAKKLSFLLAASSLLVLILFFIHILQNKPYEVRTLVAMPIRTFFWVFISIAILKSKRF